VTIFFSLHRRIVVVDSEMREERYGLDHSAITCMQCQPCALPVGRRAAQILTLNILFTYFQHRLKNFKIIFVNVACRGFELRISTLQSIQTYHWATAADVE